MDKQSMQASCNDGPESVVHANLNTVYAVAYIPPDVHIVSVLHGHTTAQASLDIVQGSCYV